MSDNTIYVIDGFGFVFRAYHVQPPLTTPNGSPIGAIYGFTSMLLKIINDFKPKYIVVALDSGTKNFRHELYNEYKSNRPEPSDDLKKQLPYVNEVMKSLGIPSLMINHVEADDIIACVTEFAKKSNKKTVIVSSDKDLTQLITEDVSMYDPVKNRYIRTQEVIDKFGVAPNLMKDYLALVGDSSDNIPGAQGIGPKTATELLNKYHSLDGIYEKLEDIKQSKRKESLINSKELVALSKKLVTLNTDIDINLDLNEFLVKTPNQEIISNFINDNGFKSLINRVESLFDVKINSGNSISNQESNLKNKEIALKEIDNKDKMHAVYKGIKEAGYFSYYISISKENAEIYLSFNDSEIYQIPISNEDNLLTSFSNDKQNWIIPLKNLFQDSSIKKITFDHKNSIKYLSKIYDIADILKFSKVEDIMLMEYVLSAGQSKIDLMHLLNKHNPNSKNDIHENLADFIYIYYNNLKSLKDISSLSLYYDIELPVSKVLFQMEHIGIRLNSALLQELSNNFSIEINKLQNDIYSESKCEFNIASPKQLSHILFSEMKLPAKKKSSKADNYSTSSEVLEELSFNGYKIADLIIRWRQLSKLKNTYTDSLPKEINISTKRVHTTFMQHVTTTGRLSSHEPNLQNIPTRTKEGNSIREAFVAQNGYTLISADYSQIELRILSHIANIESLKNAFKEGHDIHTETACKIFNLNKDQILPEHRRKAKAINFGIIYGISSFGLAKQLSIERAEAKEYISNYFNKYPGIENYMKETIDFAKKYGFVQNILGRRCYLPSINSSNHNLAKFAERAAINAPIQGTASEIVKIAMINCNKIIYKNQFKTKLLLQIHDELIFESPNDEVVKAKELINNIMKNSFNLEVPLDVTVKTGSTWKNMN